MPMYGYATPLSPHFHVVFDVHVLKLNFSSNKKFVVFCHKISRVSDLLQKLVASLLPLATLQQSDNNVVLDFYILESTFG